jgi:hypothetical protein
MDNRDPGVDAHHADTDDNDAHHAATNPTDFEDADHADAAAGGDAR